MVVASAFSLFAGQAAPHNQPQLFDFSIWRTSSPIEVASRCRSSAALGNQVTMPSKWFPVDLYTHATAQIQPVSGSAGPTLFVAAKGSGSSLHVDTLQMLGL